MFELLSAPTLEELRTKVDEFLKDKPNAMVEYRHIAIITDTTGDAFDTVKLPLGSIVTFVAYPDIRWVVQHIDGDDVYLAAETVVQDCQFGRNNATDIRYSESTLYAHCMMYLNGTIPNIADYLEDVTVNGVTAKVFVPSYKQLKSEWDWPKAEAGHRRCTYQGVGASAYWTSSPDYSNFVWYVNDNGDFKYTYPTNTGGFRPAIKLNLKNCLMAHPTGLRVGV